jgi:hypothetical protein
MSAPEYAALSNFNMTAQWFYAKFVRDDDGDGGIGRSFPLGPPPHYGFEENEGYDYFYP